MDSIKATLRNKYKWRGHEDQGQELDIIHYLEEEPYGSVISQVSIVILTIPSNPCPIVMI